MLALLYVVAGHIMCPVVYEIQTALATSRPRFSFVPILGCRISLPLYIWSRKSSLFCCQFIFISTPTKKEFLSKSESSHCTEQGSHLDRICLRRSCMTFVYAFTSTTYDTTGRGEPSRKP